MKGLIGLFQSRKATLVLIILATSASALFTGHLDSSSFAMIVSTIGVIYNWTQHKTDISSQEQNTALARISGDQRSFSSDGTEPTLAKSPFIDTNLPKG